MAKADQLIDKVEKIYDVTQQLREDMTQLNIIVD